MDEYERASADFKATLRAIPDSGFTQILDAQTKDPDCRSVQTILSHVIWSGYAYANYIRKAFGTTSNSPPERLLTYGEGPAEFDAMLVYTVQTLDGRWEMPESEMFSYAMDTSWGERYDLEQMLEHAIVHVLRHRRQIERLTGKAG
jgi:hypothetical protein